MAYDPITTAEIQSGEPVLGPVGFGQKVKDNFNYLYGQLGASGAESVPNGSFEVDSDSDGTPDAWTVNLYPSGSFTIEATDVAHGSKSIKFTHPGGAGNGGGYIDSDYIEATEYEVYRIALMIKSSGLDVKNEVYMRYYDKDKISVSDYQCYSSSNSPTSWKRLIYHFRPPATTRYMKVRLIGGHTDYAVAGTVLYDFVTVDAVMIRRALVSTGPVSIPNNSSTLISWAGYYYDDDSMWSVGDPTKLIVPSPGGRIRVSSRLDWSANAIGIRRLMINYSGSYESMTRNNVGGTYKTECRVVSPIKEYYTPGADFTVEAYQNSGGPLDCMGWFMIEVFAEDIG